MKFIGGIIFAFILLFSFQQKEEKIVCMNRTSTNSEIVHIDSIYLELNDTIYNKTIKIYSDKNGYPIQYSRNIVTGVCIDGECRLVSIKLFWNITGRYLGFELADGEFLSKTKHKPFKPEEYVRLHQLLAEVNSPLISFTMEELVPKNSSKQNVDAVSSATISAVLDYIVEGAVYTTYTLYHIVYGPTKREIEEHTIKQLNSELTLKILNSNNQRDQIWVLNHISAEMEILTDLRTKLMDLISGDDIYIAERALNSLNKKAISDEIQIELANIFQSSGLLQKQLILQKLKRTDKLNPDAIAVLSTQLDNLNGELTKSLLDLYRINSVEDVYTVSEVAKLLKNDNRYISNQASQYLLSIEYLDKKTKKTLDKFNKSKF